jgi:ubiquinone/menaquinone biosynthesis C-methylase UbiE
MKDEFSLEAKIYDKIWGRYDYDADVRFLDELFRTHNCRSIIDIGCGTGNHALKLSKLGYDITGLDVSSAMLEKAKEKDRMGKIKFIQGNMKKLEVPIPRGRKFDAAICLGAAISHMTTNKNMKTFLNGLHTMLKKDGLFIFDARNAKKINEDYLNKLRLEHVITEDKLQLLFLTYNTRHPRNRNVIIWRPICVMNDDGKVDLQIREHALRWFHFPKLQRMLAENHFEVVEAFSGNTKEAFKEDEHGSMLFVTIAK